MVEEWGDVTRYALSQHPGQETSRDPRAKIKKKAGRLARSYTRSSTTTSGALSASGALALVAMYS
jgi:hypothetical protein